MQAIVAIDVVSTVTSAHLITGNIKIDYSTDGMVRVIVPLYAALMAVNRKY